jgi:hypothetical protein
MRKSRRFGMHEGGGTKGACGREVDCFVDSGADRLWMKERQRKWTGCLDEMSWRHGYGMQKWENEDLILIGRTANLTATRWGVVGCESDKMLAQKMQEKKKHGKDISEEQLKVVVYSGPAGTCDAKSD